MLRVRLYYKRNVIISRLSFWWRYKFSSQTYLIYGKYYFYCQHGQRECYANMLQACGLMQTSDQDKQFGFVNCAMSSVDPADRYEICEVELKT